MNAMPKPVVQAGTSLPTVPGQHSSPDPLDGDMPSDEVVVTTRRGMIRMALVATEAASRFQREGVHDAMAWMLSPRKLFGGRTAVDACVSRDACMRGVLLHGLSLGLDADPDLIDELVADGELDSGEVPGDDPSDAMLATGGVSRNGNVTQIRPNAGPAERLYTATIVHDGDCGTVHGFHASFAVDEAEVAARLRARMGAAAEDAAIVSGFDHTCPIVEALVSRAICDTLMMIDAEPMSPLAAGLDLNIEQRFTA